MSSTCHASVPVVCSCGLILRLGNILHLDSGEEARWIWWKKLLFHLVLYNVGWLKWNEECFDFTKASEKQQCFCFTHINKYPKVSSFIPTVFQLVITGIESECLHHICTSSQKLTMQFLNCGVGTRMLTHAQRCWAVSQLAPELFIRKKKIFVSCPLKFLNLLHSIGSFNPLENNVVLTSQYLGDR